MFNRLTLLSNFLAWSVLAGLCMGQPGSVRGRVRDDGKTPPNDGIPTVSVTMAAAGGNIDAVTAADGTFEVKGVPLGDATISLVKLGYAKRPTEKSLVVVAGDNPALDFYMWQPGERRIEYFAAVAHNLMDRVSKDKVRRHGLAVEWVHLTSSGIPLRFKWDLVAEWHKIDDGLAQDLPICGDYRAIGIDKIAGLQELCLRAAHGQARFPDQVGEFIAKERISNRLCADALVSTMYSVGLNTVQQRAFAAKLQELRVFGDEVNAAVTPWSKMPKIDWDIRNPERANDYNVLLQSYMPKSP